MLRRDVTKECAHTVSMCKVVKQLKNRPRGAAWSASQQDPVGLRPTRALRTPRTAVRGPGGRLFQLGCTAHAYWGIACVLAAGCPSVESRGDRTLAHHHCPQRPKTAPRTILTTLRTVCAPTGTIPRGDRARKRLMVPSKGNAVTFSEHIQPPSGLEPQNYSDLTKVEDIVLKTRTRSVPGTARTPHDLF